MRQEWDSIETARFRRTNPDMSASRKYCMSSEQPPITVAVANPAAKPLADIRPGLLFGR